MHPEANPQACSIQGSPTRPPITPLTGWGGCAVATNWKLVLESGQSAWRGESTQHRGEEEGVGGHRVPIEVPSPRCRTGAAVAGHARRQAGSPAEGSGGLQAAPPRGMGPGPEGGLGDQPNPLLSWGCCPRPAG